MINLNKNKVVRTLKIGAVICAFGIVYLIFDACVYRDTPREGLIVRKVIEPRSRYVIKARHKNYVIGEPHTKRFYAKAASGDTIRFYSFYNQLLRNDNIIATELNRDARAYTLLVVLMLLPLIIFVPYRICGIVHANGTLAFVSVVEAYVVVILVFNVRSSILRFFE